MGAENLVQAVEDFGDAKLGGFRDVAGEVLPEFAQQVLPVEFAGRDLVELLLERRREIIFDVAGKEVLEEGGDEAALVLRHEALLVHADIVAVAQRLERRGVSGGTADAELLHALDEARLGEAGRWLGEMLLGTDFLGAELVAARDLGQTVALVGIVRFVAAFLIETEETVEDDDGAGGAEADGGIVGLDFDGGALELHAFHLARDGAVPDQFVEPALVVVEAGGNVLRQAREIGRADRFMRFLRVLRLGVVDARAVGEIGLAEFVVDDGAGLRDRFRRDLDAVGSHVGDEAGRLAVDLDAFVKPLRDLHGAAGGETELAGGFLLQRRGGEGRVRVAPRGLALDGGDGEARGLDARNDVGRRLLVRNVELAEFPAVECDEAGDEGGAATRLHVGFDGPVFLAAEGLNLQLAVADETERDGLHAAGRARARKLAPENGREGEADEIVERAAGEIGVDQFLVEPARMLHRFGNGFLGDGVEDDALDLDVLQDLLLVEDFEHMPGDGLALAIRVGCEDEPVRALHGGGDLVQALLGLGVHVPGHGEVVIRLDRAVLGGQVADMAVGGQDLVVLAQILVDGFRLCGRLNNDDVHWTVALSY